MEEDVLVNVEKKVANRGGRPKGATSGYSHSVGSLVQRNKAGNNHPAAKGEGKLVKSFFEVPVDSNGNKLVDDVTLRVLYEQNLRDFSCEPVFAMVKLGAKVSTLLDMQQMVDAKQGVVLSKTHLDAVKVLRDLADTVAKLKFGSHQTIVEHKNRDFLNSDEVIDVSSFDEKHGGTK
jgi:hypothetical protein